MYFFKITVLIILLASNNAIAETDFGALIDLVGKVVESAAKINNPELGVDPVKDGQQSSNSETGSLGEISGSSELLSLQQPLRTLDRTLKLIPSDSLMQNNAAGFFVTPRGKLVVWGSNENARLGLAEAKYSTSADFTEYQYQKFYSKPVIHPAFDGVVSVDACRFRALVLTNKGEAWIFGNANTANHKAAPDYFIPTKIPGSGYVEAKINCFGPGMTRENINLLKNDGTFWRMDGYKGSGDSLTNPIKLVSGVKNLQTVNVTYDGGLKSIAGFILLLNNGKVATTFHHVYEGTNNKAEADASQRPKLAVFPNLKDIVRIQSNTKAPYFTAYASDGSIYEVPLRGFVAGKLSNGLSASFASKSKGLGKNTGFPAEQSEPLTFNNYKLKGTYTYTSLIKPTEIANAKSICYASSAWGGSGYYGLMLDKSGAVSAWSLGKRFQSLGVEDKLIPQKISWISDVDEFECGDQFILFKLKNGDIKIYADKRSVVAGVFPIKDYSINPLFNENFDFAASN